MKIEEKYDLKEIEYESWDSAFDAYNKAKKIHSDLSFDVWYEQQISWLAFQAHKDSEETRLLQEQIDHESESLLKILSHIFQQYKLLEEKHDQDYDDEWDPWDEDEEDLPF